MTCAMNQSQRLKTFSLQNGNGNGKAKRLNAQFWSANMEHLEDNFELLNVLTNETHFYFSWHANKHNYRFVARKQPHWHVERSLGIENKTVWRVLKRTVSLVHTFFEDNGGYRMTIDFEQYINVLRRRFILALRSRWGCIYSCVSTRWRLHSLF